MNFLFFIFLFSISFPSFSKKYNDDFFIRYPEEKIVTQFYNRLGSVPVPEEWIQTTLAFFNTPQAPDFRWSDYLPSLTKSCQIKFEKLLDQNMMLKHASALFAFFQKYPPCTITGWNAYCQVTYKFYPQEYPKVLNRFLTFWTSRSFSDEEEAAVVSFFKTQSCASLRSAVQQKYQDLVLKKKWKKIGVLIHLFPEFFPDRLILGLALKMIEKNKDAEVAFEQYQGLSAEHQKHPLLSLAVFEFLIRKNQIDLATQEWNKGLFPHQVSLGLKLFSTLLLESKKPLHEVCIEISSILNPLIDSKTEDWYDASLALGTMWYYEGQSPAKALPYFQKVIQAFKANTLPETRKIRLYAKSLFFAAQCLRHSAFPQKCFNEKNLAQQYLAQAARYPSLFYGQCASFMLNKKFTLPHLTENKKQQLTTPLQKKIFQIASLFKKKQLQAFAEGKERRGEGCENLKNDCIKHIYTEQDALPFLNLFQDWSRSAMVEIGHFLQYAKGFFFNQSYPILNIETPVPDSKLVHSIIFVESKFNPFLEGDAKERGLMQVLPVSGEEAAKFLKIPFSLNKLWSQEYNILIGNREIQRWINYFNGQYIYGIAAYNAGPSPVRRWIDKTPIHKTGNDEKDLEQIVYWIERMTYPMVRIYVEFVLSAYAIYCAKNCSITLNEWMQKPFFR